MADSLTPTSRSFYERIRLKAALSFFLGSISLVALAYCTVYGGLAQASGLQAKYYRDNTNDDTQKTAEDALTAGYGN